MIRKQNRNKGRDIWRPMTSLIALVFVLWCQYPPLLIYWKLEKINIVYEGQTFGYKINPDLIDHAVIFSLQIFLSEQKWHLFSLQIFMSEQKWHLRISKITLWLEQWWGNRQPTYKIDLAIMTNSNWSSLTTETKRTINAYVAQAEQRNEKKQRAANFFKTLT